jgi:hypothetical protein
MWLVLLFYIILCPTKLVFSCNLPKTSNSILLNQQALYSLSYSIENKDEIFFLLEINSLFSWIGLGFSESGHMLGSDLVILNQNDLIIKDMFVPWSSSPNINPIPIDDHCNDYQLLCSNIENNNQKWKVLIKRKLDTKDTQDRVINNDIYTIFAWGKETFSFHGPNRGTIKISYLLDHLHPSTQHTLKPNEIKFTNYLLTPIHTSYVLQKFIIPTTSSYVYSYSAYIDQLDLVHHFLLHDCGDNITSYPLNELQLNTPLLANWSPLGVGNCQSLVVTWIEIQ